MPNQLSAKENLEQQFENNSTRMNELVDQQYNVEITRSIVLFFSSSDEDCAKSLTKALFAKGTRVLTRDPEPDGDRFRIRVGVKRGIRDIVREEVTRDLVETAAGMNGSYDGWDLLSDDAAEETQHHDPQHPEQNPQVF
jgi:hypothetical protein